MIEELSYRCQFHKRKMSLTKANQMTLFPEPAIEQEIIRGHHMMNGNVGKSNARFPCIHKKGSVDFH